ncbi:hypothetical protein HMPREF1870_02765, partial [Bacteroidales bacterium KA00344]
CKLLRAVTFCFEIRKFCRALCKEKISMSVTFDTQFYRSIAV